MQSRFLRVALLVILLWASSLSPILGGLEMAQAFEPYSKKAGQSFSQLPDAKKGGTIYLREAGNPKVLNPTINNDVNTTNILGYLFAHLFHKDYETNEYFPALAEKLEVSDDRKVYTFTLRATAKWEDGTPITTDDVEFTYQKLWDPKVDAAPKRAYIGPFQFEKLDSRVFKFKVESPHVNTLSNFNEDFVVIQKKQFEGVADFNLAKGIMQPVSSGPYRLKNFSRDQKIELERVKGWWGESIPQFKNLYNFDQMIYRIIPDNTLAYEKFIKGEIDLLEMNAELFGTRVKMSDKDKFGKGPPTGKGSNEKAMWAEHFKTDAPAPFTIVAWNLKKPQFLSKKTRQALAQLIPYSEITEKVYHNEGIRCVSPFGSNTLNTSPDMKTKAWKYDPVGALKLLKEDGWIDNGQNQLVKVIDGKNVPFEFSLKYNSENVMRSKVAQMLKESFKKAGITVRVQAIEWNSLTTDINNRQFDAVVFGWGKGSINPDANQLWHTKSYENQGSNFSGYSSPQVDALIADTLKELDPKKRSKIVQKIGALIYDDQPNAFIVEMPGFMMAANSKIQSKKWAMKYDDAPPIWMYYSK
jgi:peptide/nickel transport system substrate-binding protein